MLKKKKRKLQLHLIIVWLYNLAFSCLRRIWYKQSPHLYPFHYAYSKLIFYLYHSNPKFSFTKQFWKIVRKEKDWVFNMLAKSVVPQNCYDISQISLVSSRIYCLQLAGECKPSSRNCGFSYLVAAKPKKSGIFLLKVKKIPSFSRWPSLLPTFRC